MFSKFFPEKKKTRNGRLTYSVLFLSLHKLLLLRGSQLIQFGQFFPFFLAHTDFDVDTQKQKRIHIGPIMTFMCRFFGMKIVGMCGVLVCSLSSLLEHPCDQS